MQTEQEVKQRRPFHETVVDLIHFVPNHLSPQADGAMDTLARLIKLTMIPKDHETIIAAWKQTLKKLGFRESIDFGVPADLLEQKQEAEKQEAQKREEEKNKAKKQVEDAAKRVEAVASWSKRGEYS